MIMFTKIGSNDWVATNSTKITNIRLERAGYVVYTPEGRSNDNFTSAGPFVSFEAAKRNAEINNVIAE